MSEEQQTQSELVEELAATETVAVDATVEPTPVVEEPKQHVEDLAAWVERQFVANAHPRPEEWRYRLQIVPTTGEGLLSEYEQIFVINRALRYLLGDAPMNTFDIRLMIQDIPDKDTWKAYLSEYVIPFIASNDLV